MQCTNGGAPIVAHASQKSDRQQRGTPPGASNSHSRFAEEAEADKEREKELTVTSGRPPSPWSGGHSLFP